MSKGKIVFQQMLMISTGILFAKGINGLVTHLTGADFFFEWYHPFSIILLGLLCALPTLLFILDEDGKKRRFPFNLVLHCLSIWVLVVILGRIFHWYFTLKQFLNITIDYVVIYIFVWAATLWILRAEDKKINQALKEIQDDE